MFAGSEKFKNAVEFTEIFSTINSLSFPLAGFSSSRPGNAVSATLIWFLVSVPVLSVQITVVAPIVSVACILRTRLFVLSILLMLIASDSVTDIGSPSGTATTMSVTATMK